MFSLDCWENLEAPPYNFDRKVVFPQILPVMTNSRNEVIGIERELNPSGLIYKRPLALRYLGTQEPDEVGALIGDWDKFIALGEEIARESGGRVKMVAGLGDMTSILQAQYVEPVFEGDAIYATKYFTKILDVLVRISRGNMAGKLQTYSPAWNQSFLDETYIFYPCAPWTAQWILKPNDPDSAGRWGVTTAPGKGYSFGGTAYGIPANAKNKARAWKFIQWATTTEDGVAACADVVGAIVSLEAAYAGGFPSEPDPSFAGQNSNGYLMEKAAPTMEIRVVHQYDVVLTDILTLIAESIANNPAITTEQAVQSALVELKNKLPPGANIL
jgi:multiple sugar transport system substrate-binding protein